MRTTVARARREVREAGAAVGGLPNALAVLGLALESVGLSIDWAHQSVFTSIDFRSGLQRSTEILFDM